MQRVLSKLSRNEANRKAEAQVSNTTLEGN
jgi:hypothetical protein